MASSYTGNPNNPFGYSITIPTDGVDPVSAYTVNDPFKLILDNEVNILSNLKSYRPHIMAQSTTGGAVQIWPFNNLMVYNGTQWMFATNTNVYQIVNADIEGGALAANKDYYVYCYTTNGVALFNVSEKAPDATKTFKSDPTPLITHRYLCSFQTNAGSVPYPFMMQDWDYAYRTSRQYAFQAGALTANTWTPLTAIFALLPTVRTVKAHLSANNTAVLGTFSNFRIASTGFDPTWYMVGRINGQTPINYTFEMPPGSAGQFSVYSPDSTFGAIEISIDGYKE